MRTLILAALLAVSSLTTGSGCKIICRNCDSHYRPSELPAVPSGSRVG